MDTDGDGIGNISGITEKLTYIKELGCNAIWINPCTDRYIWTDSIWEEPKGYGSLRGISDRDGSCAVNFFSHQPALNYGFYKPDRPWQQAMDAEGPMATRKAMMDVIRFWLSKGCDGFRVDMAGSLVKNDEDSKGTIALWQDVRKILDEEFPNAAFVSEWGEPLVYMRTFNDEKILVVINPSDEAAKITLEHNVSKLIYCFGKAPKINGNSITANSISAFFATL